MFLLKNHSMKHKVNHEKQIFELRLNLKSSLLFSCKNRIFSFLPQYPVLTGFYGFILYA